MMAQVFGDLSPTWKTWRELWNPGLSLAESQMLQAFGKCTAGLKMSVPDSILVCFYPLLCLSAKNIEMNKNREERKAGYNFLEEW